MPVALEQMMLDQDPRKPERMMKALFQMVKLDIETLKRAYEQS